MVIEYNNNKPTQSNLVSLRWLDIVMLTNKDGMRQI